MSYPIAENEIQRINALADLNILDSPREEGFDALVELGRDIFDVPIGIISLVDHDRQWFKAVSGLDICETDRTASFCNHTICSNKPFVVNDASQDERFRNNPLVSGPPHIRFYAGVPLALSPGINLGTLCMVDHKPRHFDSAKIQRLTLLGKLTVSFLRQYQVAKEVSALSDNISRKTDVISTQNTALRRQKHLLDHASALAKMGAWETDLLTGTVSWSDGMYTLHELDRTFEPKYQTILDRYPEPDRERLVNLMEQSRRYNKPFVFEGRMFTARGQFRWVRVVGDVEFDAGHAVRRFGLWQDITDEKAMTDQVQQLARCDDLTGLNNRKALRDKLAEVAAAVTSAQRPVTLLIFDVDNFKDINDTHGHAAGDECLHRIAHRLRVELNDDCFVARLGGDEFAILANGKTSSDRIGDLPERLAECIRRATTRPVEWMGNSFQLTASIGIATRVNVQPFLPDELMREADLALYDAKAAGRGCYRTFRPALHAASREKFETLRNVKNALTLRQLELYYQPKVGLADQTHKGFEALLRWNRFDGRVVAPAGFRAALEDHKLSKEIGDYVIDYALEQAKSWTAMGVPFGHIAVNLSASQFEEPKLAERLLAAISAKGLSPNIIQVEITEGVLLSPSSSHVLKACKSFREAGIRIAFDDFGTGFASLTHLRDYPVDIIKIDRSFISDLDQGENTTVIVNAIVALAHNLSMQVVAEGVELDSQVAFLKAIGCDQAQGYLYGRPVTAAAAVRHLLDVSPLAQIA